MKRMGFYLNFILLFVLLSQVYAEEFSLSSSVDKEKLTLRENLTLTIKISERIKGSPKIKLPELNEFEILSRNRTQNISIKKGKVSYSNSFSFILRPKVTGKLTIGSVELRYKGRLYTTEPIEIEVLPAGKKLPQEKLPELKGEVIL